MYGRQTRRTALFFKTLYSFKVSEREADPHQTWLFIKLVFDCIFIPGYNSPCGTVGSGWLRSPPSAAPYRPAAAYREAASQRMTSQMMATKSPTKVSACHRDQSPRSRMNTRRSHRPLARSTVIRKRCWSVRTSGESDSAPCWAGVVALSAGPGSSEDRTFLKSLLYHLTWTFFTNACLKHPV